MAEGTAEAGLTREEHDELVASLGEADVLAQMLDGRPIDGLDWKALLARRAQEQATYLQVYPNDGLALQFDQSQRALHTLCTHLSNPATRGSLLALLRRDRRTPGWVATLLEGKGNQRALVDFQAIADYARANPRQEMRLIEAVADAAEEGKAHSAEDRQRWCDLYYGPNGVIANAIAERRRVHRGDRPKPWAKEIAKGFDVGGRTIVNQLREHFWTQLDDDGRDRCRRAGVAFSPLDGETPP